MRMRTLGRTGLEVSEISFGCIKLPKVDEETAVAALRRAVELGVNFFDTARGYRDSEAKVGKALEGLRDQVVLATKTTARDKEAALTELETSLRELRTEYVDLWQLHSVSDEATFDRVMGPGGAIEAAFKAKDQGKTRHVGVTIHRCHKTMRRAINSGVFETIMVAYSVLDQEAVEPEILPLAARRGMGVIAMKSLSGGLLAQPDSLNARPVGQLDPVVFGALRYVLSNDAVSAVIPGMSSVREVEENVQVGDSPLPMDEDELRELRRLIGGLGAKFRYGQMCLRCGYCQPCPQGLPIPDIFRAADMFQSYPEHLRHMGVELFLTLEVGPEQCAECGECLEKCPAGLPIPDKLKEVRELFAQVK